MNFIIYFFFKEAFNFLQSKINNDGNDDRDNRDGNDESNFSLILEDKDTHVCKTMAKRSPFGREFTQLYEAMYQLRCTVGDKNPYHLPLFTKSLLTFFMPLAPLWTGLMISGVDNLTTRLILYHILLF